jgi:hypothetical protein
MIAGRRKSLFSSAASSDGHDLDVSYSDPHRNHLYRWSCTFIDNLREEIERLLSGSGRKPDVWMDPALKPMGSLEGNLKKEIQSSALLITRRLINSSLAEDPPSYRSTAVVRGPERLLINIEGVT